MQLTHPDFIKDATSEWEGERAANGRPLVSDDILKRMELVTTEEAWGVCRRNGYNDQFAGDWKILHPDHVLVGRAVTARYVPLRPDINNAVEELGKKEGRIGGQNSWVIDTLVEGDVLVVELFGSPLDSRHNPPHGHQIPVSGLRLPIPGRHPHHHTPGRGE